MTTTILDEKCYICYGKMVVRGQNDRGHVKCFMCLDGTNKTHRYPKLTRGQMRVLFDIISGKG
jgi:hypothetical protein